MWFIAGLVGLVVILGLFYGWVSGADLGALSFGERPREPQPLPLLQVLESAGAMLVGIVFGAMHEHLKVDKAKGGVYRRALEALNSASFLRSVLASPIVFAAVYLAAQKQPDQVIALIFAFQNGFFCNAILQRRGLPK